MSRTWTELAIEVPAPAAEVLAVIVGELTGGVEVRDSGTLLSAAPGRTIIVTQCDPAIADQVLEEVAVAAERLRVAGLSPDPWSVRRRAADEDEWRDVWKQYFRAQRVGVRFLIRPEWDPVPARPDDLVIDIEPGRAFGTGGHASTRLVIAMAEERADVREPRPVARFLDLGCGSGILAIAAARLWPAAAGLAIDVDPEATATAEENLARNRITTVEVRTGTLADAPGPFDLVLANIEAPVLIPIAGEVAACLAPGGEVILSGVLADVADAVAAAYRAAGLRAEGRRDEDEWASLRFARPAP